MAAPARLKVLIAATMVACSVVVARGQQQPPPLRSSVVLVPIDVRVLDENGNPVEGLTAADFTIYENGVRQDIAHCLTLSFADGDQRGLPRQNLPAQPGVEGFSEASQSHRTFIILLGRGRLNGPAKGIEGAIEFVRGLLPTDRVSVMAYLRVSEPSTDHDAVIRFLERYRERHEDLEGLIERDFRHHGFDVVTLTADTRRRIDALFGAEGIPRFTALPGAEGINASRYLNLTYLRRAIQFARRFHGEKHLVVLIDRHLPFSLRAKDWNDNYFVKLANESRVTLSFINTGGLPGHPTVPVLRGGGLAFDFTRGMPDWEFFAPGDHRSVAEVTGGLSSFYQYASRLFDRLDRGSRVQYLLGYYPKEAASPDTYRSIRVVVNRPGVRVQYRHGYRLAPSLSDDEEFRRAIAGEAMERALTRLADPPSVRLDFVPRIRRTIKIRASKDSEDRLALSIALDPTRLAFRRDGDRFRASLQLRILVDDPDGHQIGELTRTLDLALSPAEYAQTKKHWLEFDVTVPVQGIPARVRAAAYVYENDRTLSAVLRIEGRR